MRQHFVCLSWKETDEETAYTSVSRLFIKAVCEKHGGSMMTEADTDMWKCSALVCMV
jgi:hypothetical protein